VARKRYTDLSPEERKAYHKEAVRQHNLRKRQKREDARRREIAVRLRNLTDAAGVVGG
jgi:hypothetical protein